MKFDSERDEQYRGQAANALDGSYRTARAAPFPHGSSNPQCWALQSIATSLLRLGDLLAPVAAAASAPRVANPPIRSTDEMLGEGG